MATAPQPPVWQDGQVTALAGTTQPVGFWIRVVAAIIDWLILCVIAGVMAGVIVAIVAMVGGTSNEIAAGIGVFIGIVGLIVSAWLYEALMTSGPRGATYGKRAIGARIVRFDGTQLSFGRATARHFLKVIVTPMVPLGIGFMLAGWTKGKRALHDLMADTLVIRSS